VRAERWRHTSNPLLTADEARSWLDGVGLCLFLPRRHQFLAPAPSFVEACAGAPSEAPSREAIDNATELMRRLVAEGAILPLNLFGTPSETPDFLATREAFPYLFSLRGTRDWKTVPGGKSSPLVAEIWKLLEQQGALTAVEIQSALGRELTEAAVLRSLFDMWSNLRVLPEYEAGAATRWSLTQLRYKDALTAAGRLSQAAALSALVSLYLESVVAASSEEVETFLSPLTSRSRVRETVNGLAATRQIAMVAVGTQSMFHIAGALPEFPEAEPVREAGAEAAEKPAEADHAPRAFEGKRKPFERKPFERKPFERKPFERKAGERKSFGRKASDRPAAGEGAARSPEGERKPFPKRPPFGKKPFDKAARPFRREGRPFEGEPAAGGQRQGFPRGRSGSDGGKFPPKRFGFKAGGNGKFAGRADRSPERPAKDRPATDRPGSERTRGPRPWTPRPEGGERPFRPRREDGGGFGGKRKFSGARAGPGAAGAKFPGGKKFDAPGRGKTGGAKSGERGRPAEGGKRPFFRKRGEGESGGEPRPRPFGRPPFGGAGNGERPGRPRGGGWKGKPGGGARFAKPGLSRPGGEGSERPRSSRPAFGKPGGFSGKSGFGKGKPGGPPFAGKKFGGVKKFGARKPGGAKPPFRKRKDEGNKSAE